jgi:Tol biopolymer transport system component
MTRVHSLTTMWMLGGLLTGCGENLTEPPGTIEVTTVTTGEPTDPDGYTLRIDSDAGRLLGVNSALRISELATGTHELALDGIARNCVLTGPNPRTVSVTSGSAVQATFELECGSATGSIEITTATTGESLDTDGYLATLDAEPGRPIDSNGSLTFAAVSTGNHTVRLTAMAPNCAAGDDPRTVTVAGDTAEVHFDIVCGPPVGSILVSTVTGGLMPDADGYAVSVDGGTDETIGPNGTLTMPGLPVGDHTVQLSGVASNCSVAAENPRTVTVTNGGVAQAAFQIGCFLAGSGRLLFARNQSNRSHLYSMRQDGSDIVDLTPSMTVYDGDWSPDGSRIVFTRSRNDGSSIYVMNADGSNAVGLGVEGEVPRWSPDGSRIVFEAGGWIHTMKANGTQIVTLTAGLRPDWSPDGSHILLDKINRSNCVLFDFCQLDLYVMASDGSGVQLLKAGGMCGAWSPDGSKIAYVGFLLGLYVMNADGTGERTIAGGGFPRSSVGCPVVWSPDGSAIAYAAGQPGGSSELTVIPSTGGSGAVLASSPGSEFPESWK